MRSKYEAMRNDPGNWKLGAVYHCPDDPRVVVRQRAPIGWTWNFAHRYVFVALAVFVLVFVGAPIVAWKLGARSPIVYWVLVPTALAGLIAIAHRLSRDPGE